MMPHIEFSIRWLSIENGAGSGYLSGSGMVNKAFSYPLAEKLIKVFKKYKVDYLFIGKSGAILYGFPDTTQDIDIFPKKDKSNGERMVRALNDLGFEIDKNLGKAIIEGKDFIQIRGGPFDLDLVFAPDGIESYEKAKERSQMIAGKFPVAALEDIINSKKVAGRRRDREVLERLKEFNKFLKSNKTGKG